MEYFLVPACFISYKRQANGINPDNFLSLLKQLLVNDLWPFKNISS